MTIKIYYPVVMNMHVTGIFDAHLSFGELKKEIIKQWATMHPAYWTGDPRFDRHIHQIEVELYSDRDVRIYKKNFENYLSSIMNGDPPYHFKVDFTIRPRLFEEALV